MRQVLPNIDPLFGAIKTNYRIPNNQHLRGIFFLEKRVLENLILLGIAVISLGIVGISNYVFLMPSIH